MANTVYVAINDWIDGDTINTFPVDLELIKQCWIIPNFGAELEHEELCDKWCTAHVSMCIVGDTDAQNTAWLDILLHTGKVRDTSETICWAIAPTAAQAIEHVKLEMARWPN